MRVDPGMRGLAQFSATMRKFMRNALAVVSGVLFEDIEEYSVESTQVVWCDIGLQ